LLKELNQYLGGSNPMFAYPKIELLRSNIIQHNLSYLFLHKLQDNLTYI